MSEQQRIDAIYAKLKQIIANDPLRHQNLLVQIKGNRMNIKFNRPKRYNAFTVDMYLTFADAVKKAQQDNNIKFIVISGQGGNFSSGNDLANFSHPMLAELGDFPDVIKANSRVLKQFTLALIRAKKPIIALTEGKVIGFTFTMLPLLDKVFSVQNSEFVAPLVSSAQGPQLCASYLFPKIFGMSVAQQLVTFGKVVKPDYLQKYNFLVNCKTKQEANQKLQQYLNKIDDLQWNSYFNARRLYRQRQVKILQQVTQSQLKNLVQRWLNPQLLTHMAKHMQRMKNKAKL